MDLIRLFLQTSWITLIFAVFTGLLSGFSSAGLIAIINLTFRDTIVSKTTLFWLFIGLCVLLLVFTALSQMVTSRIVQQVIFNLRVSLTRKILACPLQQLEAIGTSRLLTTLTEDVEIISNLSYFLSLLGGNIALLVGCLAYLIWLSLPLFCLLIFLMLLGIFSYQRLILRGRQFLTEARNQQDHLFQHFSTATQGIKELKLHQYRRELFLSEDLENTAEAYRHYRVIAGDMFAIAGGWGQVTFFLPIGLFIFILPLFFHLPVFLIFSYATTIIFMIGPLRGLLNVLPQFIRANVALSKINALGLTLFEQKSELLSSSLKVQLKWRTLQFKQITYMYISDREEHNFTLGPIDITFYSGELVFVVGGNGSGKSTLIKLITGLYTPSSGALLLDNQIVTDENRESYRQQFSAVFADFYLFARLLRIDCDGCQTQTYLKKLQIEHKVTINSGMLSTTALSQGQRKRLALLTAYLEDRSFYVFDEWASDQDPVFKEIFYKQLLPELKERGKTVLVVSHDDRYFKYADRLIGLEYGKIKYDKRLQKNLEV